MPATGESLFNSAWEHFKNRDVYLWGARQDGLSMCRV